jgi:hypothetical protein
MMLSRYWNSDDVHACHFHAWGPEPSCPAHVPAVCGSLLLIGAAQVLRPKVTVNSCLHIPWCPWETISLQQMQMRFSTGVSRSSPSPAPVQPKQAQIASSDGIACTPDGMTVSRPLIGTYVPNVSTVQFEVEFEVAELCMHRFAALLFGFLPFLCFSAL